MSSRLITGRNEVLAKVMFLHVSVILLTGGCLSGGGSSKFSGGVFFWGVVFLGGSSKFSGGSFLGVPPNFRGGSFFGGVPPNFGGVSFGGGFLQFSRGIFLGGILQIFGGGVFFWGGSSKFSGGLFFGGGSPPEYGQRSACTHPTGMHSCFCSIHISSFAESFLYTIHVAIENSLEQ